MWSKVQASQPLQMFTCILSNFHKKSIVFTWDTTQEVCLLWGQIEYEMDITEQERRTGRVGKITSSGRVG